MKKIVLLIAGVLVAVAAYSDGYDFDVKVTGEGQPMILIPGLSSHGDTYLDVVGHYKEKYECHVLTLPGFAGQPAREYDHFLTSMRDEVIRYTQENGLDGAVIMGHSLGGFLALWASSEKPGLYSKVVVIDGLPFMPAIQMPGATESSTVTMAENMRTQMASQSDEQYKAMAPMFLNTMTLDAKRVELLTEWGVKSDRKLSAQAMYELFTTDIRDDIETITSPVLVLGAWIAYKDYGATHDSVQFGYEAQFSRVVNCKVVLTDEGKHFIMWDDPDFFYSNVDQFLVETFN